MEVQIDMVEFKKEAKKMLDGKTWILLLCNLCFLGIAAVIAAVVFLVPNPLEKILTNFVYGKGLSEIKLSFEFFSIKAINVEWLCWIIYMFLRSIIFAALVYPFYVCLANVPLFIINNEKIEPAKIFVPIYKMRYFIEYAIAGVQKYVCTILWSFLFLFPGIMAHYRYSYARYIFATTEELTAGEAIAKSKELTDGNKTQLFALDMSFIGWFIVSIITCGLGLIFMIGYHEVVTAMYYKKITETSMSQANQHEKRGVLETEENIQEKSESIESQNNQEIKEEPNQTENLVESVNQI